jgi:hypothetical protein
MFFLYKLSPDFPMTKKEYEILLIIKLQALVFHIMKRKKKKFRSTLKYLYKSKLYEALSNEKLKVWHFSTWKLFEMLENEKRTKKLVFPDYV